MKRRVLYEGKFLRFVSRGTWEFVERITGDGIVVIVPVTGAGKVLLIDQFRVSVQKRVVEFPAGLVNDLQMKKKETLEEAARRELLEETGYRAGKLTYLMSGPHAAGGSSSVMTFFLATELVREGEGGGDETEDIHSYEVSMDRVEGWLERMRKKGFLIDPKIYAGLYFLKSR